MVRRRRLRRQLKLDTRQKISEAEDRKKCAHAKLNEAKAMYVQLGPSNRHLLAAPEAELEHADLSVEHYQAALALYESPELDALIAEWDVLHRDDTSNHGTRYVADIESEEGDHQVKPTKRDRGQDQLGRSGSPFPICLLSLTVFAVIVGSAWPISARSLDPAYGSEAA